MLTYIYIIYICIKTRKLLYTSRRAGPCISRSCSLDACITACRPRELVRNAPHVDHSARHATCAPSFWAPGPLSPALGPWFSEPLGFLPLAKFRGLLGSWAPRPSFVHVIIGLRPPVPRWDFGCFQGFAATRLLVVPGASRSFPGSPTTSMLMP